MVAGKSTLNDDDDDDDDDDDADDADDDDHCVVMSVPVFVSFCVCCKAVDVSITLCNVTVTGTSTTFSPMMKRQRAA